jgi:hypothetical protein
MNPIGEGKMPLDYSREPLVRDQQRMPTCKAAPLQCARRSHVFPCVPAVAVCYRVPAFPCVSPFPLRPRVPTRSRRSNAFPALLVPVRSWRYRPTRLILRILGVSAFPYAPVIPADP